MRPAGALLHPRGSSTPWHSSQTKALLAWKFGLPATPRLGCSRVSFFWRTFHAAARGGSHVTRGATWLTPSSFPSSGASFGVGPVRIGFADPELLTKTLGHTDPLTDWLTDWHTDRPLGITEGRQYPDGWKSPFGEWTSSSLLHFDFESWLGEEFHPSVHTFKSYHKTRVLTGAPLGAESARLSNIRDNVKTT